MTMLPGQRGVYSVLYNIAKFRNILYKFILSSRQIRQKWRLVLVVLVLVPTGLFATFCSAVFGACVVSELQLSLIPDNLRLPVLPSSVSYCQALRSSENLWRHVFLPFLSRSFLFFFPYPSFFIFSPSLPSSFYDSANCKAAHSI